MDRKEVVSIDVSSRRAESVRPLRRHPRRTELCGAGEAAARVFGPSVSTELDEASSHRLNRTALGICPPDSASK